ncbi:MAG: DUF4424 domain-containing protein [Novosphingobium sp.]|jgi:hypothetical protein|nr:DUF4424 domain-containing protein [Novosphingobium sp.]
MAAMTGDPETRMLAGTGWPGRAALAAVLAAMLAAPMLTGPAAANDSSAELRQGGLVLVKNPGVEMRAEDLYISPGAVVVRYRFLNTTGRDRKVLVAFPMPDIVIGGPDDMVSVPRDDPQNFLGFTTRVDGQPVTARVEQKVIARGVDRTAYLKSLGVPLAPQLAATRDALDRLPAATRDRLVAMGLAVIDEYSQGRDQPWERHWHPSWTLKTAYYWEQLFPAGREIVVEHSYAPSVGTTSGTSLETEDLRQSDDAHAQKRKYCIDSSFMAAVVKAKRAVGPMHQAFFEKRIDYVLSSGANWQKPIGEFHLTVDKGRSDALVSFCMDGVKKVAQTLFEVRKTNFRPTGDLSILILEPAPEGF